MRNPNIRPLDVYTLAHAGWGMVARSAGLGLPAVLIASVVFEQFLEPELKRQRPDVFPWPGQDSTVNSILDTVAVTAGWLAAGKPRGMIPAAVVMIAAPAVFDPQILKLFRST